MRRGKWLPWREGGLCNVLHLDPEVKLKILCCDSALQGDEYFGALVVISVSQINAANASVWHPGGSDWDGACGVMPI
jgi:hypothetical protein